MQRDFGVKNLIDLSAIKSNVKEIKKATDKSLFCAVVKADAYGHGICEVANAIQDDCDCFAVSSVFEGVKLRHSGIKKQILCLLPDKDFRRADFYDVTLTAQSEIDVLELENYSKRANANLKYHLAINTGMNRLGINSLDELERIIKISNDGNALFCGAYSHFYNAKSNAAINKQFNKFTVFQSVIKKTYPNAICHVSSSGSLCKSKKYNLDMVRVGLLMYGYKPVNGSFALKRALKVTADSICVRNVKRGENLLYGNYKTSEDKRVKILPYGYSNGLIKGLNGQINRACMNLCAVENDVRCIMDDAEYVAKKNHTNVYNVLTAFGGGAQRIYYYGDGYENNSG